MQGQGGNQGQEVNQVARALKIVMYFEQLHNKYLLLNQYLHVCAYGEDLPQESPISCI